MNIRNTIIDFSFGVTCAHCHSRVLDPEKRKKQKYLLDKCPVCRKDFYDDHEVEENSNGKHIKNT
jgi:NAD-dependent SIR2 family protein deacetylase